MNYPYPDNPISIFYLLPEEEPCEASQVTAQIISRITAGMDSSAQPSLTYAGKVLPGQAEALGGHADHQFQYPGELQGNGKASRW